MRHPQGALRLRAIHVSIAIVGALATATASDARELTIDQRVAAQAAIERVYHAHRRGAGPFDEAGLSEVLRRKAEEGVRLSIALERFWNVPLPDAVLERELARMARDTRMPGRLRELFAALGDDPFLIKETLVRRAVAGRLARTLYDAEARRGDPAAEPLRGWDEWWAQVAPTLSADGFRASAAEGGALPATEASGCTDDTWSNRSLDDVPDPRRFATAVWTGAEMIVWGGYNGSIALDTGGRYDPVLDDWQPTSRGKGVPTGRYRHSAVWTGSEMIVFGGATIPGGGVTNTGSRYDPATDGWTVISQTGAPTPRWRHTAVWTGAEMIVWGGQELNGTGARYDPASNTWSPVSNVNAPTGRKDHTATWTGSQMVVWGGSENDLAGNTPNVGGRYDPLSDSWTPTSTFQAPPGRALHTAVWTGTLVIVWGGQSGGGGFTNSGGVYDPVADLWGPVSLTGAPSARLGHAAVWNGSAMLVWGGNGGGGALGDGASYDPGTGVWTPLTGAGAPDARGDHSFVWDGSRLIVWGGIGLRDVNTGGRYDPVADAWTPTTTEGAPMPRRGQTAVWTGAEMLLWGGSAGPSLDTGSAYDPALDLWTDLATTGAPAARVFHSAVWTGERMVVWGGNPDLDTGGRYDPVADAWSATSLTGAPAGRRRHTAVWTGSEMIVWGGFAGGAYFADGARYDPVGDAWTSISATAAPAGREVHSAVWTGSEMIVWGGNVAGGLTATGGRYDPATDSWSPTDTATAPTPRTEHTAVWTGSRMIVWGGNGGPAVDTGGVYDPVADAWTPTDDEGGATPAARTNHVAAWSGTEMLIWGGRAPGTPVVEYPDLGGRYDPLTDTWSQLTAGGAPPGRHDLSVVWTGEEMIVWGGAAAALAEMGTGGAYCACTSATFFRDADGDGFGDPLDSVVACEPPAGFVADGTDCDDGNGNAWAPPGEVGGVGWSDAVTVAWDAPVDPGATSVRYDVIRSEDPVDFVNSGVCVATDTTSTTTGDADVPAVGAVFHYLVRAENDCPSGMGDLGERSDGTPRQALPCP